MIVLSYDCEVILMSQEFNVLDLIKTYSLGQLDKISFRDGEYLIHEGQEINSLFFITKGKVKISQTFANGKEYMIGINGPKYILGDVEFVSELPATSSVQSIGVTEVLVLPYEQLKNKYIKEYDFMYNLFINLSHKLLESSNINTMNIIYPVRVRIASYLLSLSPDGVKVKITNYNDVANNIGCSYRHVHRALKELADKELLKKMNYGIKILNRNGLLKAANGNIYEGNS